MATCEYRNSKHAADSPKMIRGVCAWLATRIDIDVSLVRLVAALALVLSPVTTLLVYFIAAWILQPRRQRAG